MYDRKRQTDANQPSLLDLVGTISKCHGDKCWAGILRDDNGNLHKFRGNNLASLGDRVTFSGRWVNDPKWGNQFDVKQTKTQLDSSAQGIIGFLDQLPNVGPVRAHTIYRRFGADTLNVIEHTPEKLVEAEGITARMVKEIHEAFMDRAAQKDLIVFLKGLGLTDGKIKKILNKYGKDAPSVIKNNPYQLIQDIDGFGFKTVDEIALRAGIRQDSPERIRAGLIFALQEAQQEGHCFLDKDQLINYACREILKIRVGIIAEELEIMGKPNPLTPDMLPLIAIHGNRVYLTGTFRAELSVAADLRIKLQGNAPLLANLPETE